MKLKVNNNERARNQQFQQSIENLSRTQFPNLTASKRTCELWKREKQEYYKKPSSEQQEEYPSFVNIYAIKKSGISLYLSEAFSHVYIINTLKSSPVDIHFKMSIQKS